MLRGMSDERVAAAVRNWAPRFIANGIDYSDFIAITARIESWDAWCEQWCVAGAVHEQLGRAALADGRERSAGTHLSQAAVYYHFAKFLFVDDPGQLRAAHLMAVRCASDALPYLEPPGERVGIPFDGTELAAVLRRPAGPGPHPLVVLIPGLDSAKEEFRPTEQEFLRRGLATLAVDGPGQGEAEYELPVRPDWEVLGDAITGAAAAIPGIDHDRIGLWGVSLGGYYAVRLASGDARFLACVALSGPYSLGDAWDTLPGLTRRAFEVRSRSGSPEQARQRAGDFTMAGRPELITAPVLVIAGRRDRLFPYQDAERLATEIGARAELLLLPDGNHGCANVSYQHRPYAADWLAARLLPAQADDSPATPADARDFHDQVESPQPEAGNPA
jgi:dienelactone hydrolase